VLLEGRPADVDQEARALGAEFDPVDGSPLLPRHRRSARPAESLRTLSNSELAEVGVGTIHTPEPPPQRELEGSVLDLNQRVKAQFDPMGRLNPGRRVP
jgi:FAD/FMN-containing dehydrogenase